MKDKQVYRELKEVTPEALDVVKNNFAWIEEKVKVLSCCHPTVLTSLFKYFIINNFSDLSGKCLFTEFSGI